MKWFETIWQRLTENICLLNNSIFWYFWTSSMSINEIGWNASLFTNNQMKRTEMPRNENTCMCVCVHAHTYKYTYIYIYIHDVVYVCIQIPPLSFSQAFFPRPFILTQQPTYMYFLIVMDLCKCWLNLLDRYIFCWKFLCFCYTSLKQQSDFSEKC